MKTKGKPTLDELIDELIIETSMSLFKTWWMTHIEMVDDYRTILRLAIDVGNDFEMENYPQMAEQRWAIREGLA